MRPVGRTCAVILGASWGLVSTSPGAGAQDVESGSLLRGVPVPAAYYETIARDPAFFELPNGWFDPAPGTPSAAAPGGAAAGLRAATGTLRLLVVPALFADSPQPGFGASHLDAALFSGPATAGTLTDFYEEASRGNLRVTGTVTPWVRTRLSMPEVVGTSAGLGPDSRIAEYLVDALSRIDPSVDFGLFDNDGPDGVPNSGDDDGFVDAVAFEFLEIAASCGGPAIWPHRSGIAGRGGGPWESGDSTPAGQPVRVNGYIIQSATDCSGDAIQTASVIAHELGHVLGLPDLYHPIDGRLPEQRRWVVGCWGLMAGGTWGCGDGTSRGASFGPTHFSPWSKLRLGWLELDEVGDVRHGEFVLEPSQTSGRALLIPLDPEGRESLVVEYRPQLGFDAWLPSSGVLVYRWDLDGVLRPPRDSGIPYQFVLQEADGDLALQRTPANGGDRGVGPDAFALAGGPARLSSVTTPSSRRNSGALTTVTIHSMEVVGGRARIRVSTTEAPGAAAVELPPASVLSPLEARIRLGGGALPYVASLDDGVLPEGVRAAVEDDELVLAGAPLETGSYPVIFGLQDARGVSGSVLLPLSVGEFFVTDARLVEPFLAGATPPLTEPEKAHLDGIGNENGRYDVGDVRAWLRRGG